MKRSLAAELKEGMHALAASRAGKAVHGIKRTLLTAPEVKAEYDALGDEFAMARELIAARARAGLSQAEVAQRMGTTQSVVARLESSKRPPSLRMVQRYVRAVGTRAVVRLEA